MNVFNSLTNSTYTIEPNTKINWYCCGPTIYSDSHLGHARTYITFDSMIRYMRYKNVDVTYAMNITDIDDKIINRIRELNGEITELNYIKFVEENEIAFWNDMKRINVEVPNKIGRVREVIPDILKFIEKLRCNNYAYETSDAVWFNMENYLLNPNYSEYITNLTNNSELDQHENVYDKKNPRDFALWKYKGDFEYSFCKGRPGWHIECSVLMNSMLGEHVHIHSGGIDLKFPHHCNEVIQSTAYYSNTKWVDCFVHTGHLHINGVKMSKSIGNVRSIKSFCENYSANTLRISFLMNMWDRQLDYNDQLVTSAMEYNEKIKKYLCYLERVQIGVTTIDVGRYRTEFEDYLSNGFDTHSAFNTIIALISATSGKELNETSLKDTKLLIHDFLQIYGLVYNVLIVNDPIVVNVVSTRTELRKLLTDKTPNYDIIESLSNILVAICSYQKNIVKNIKKDYYELVDYIRDSWLKNMGYYLEDTGPQSMIHYVSEEPNNT